MRKLQNDGMPGGTRPDDLFPALRLGLAISPGVSRRDALALATLRPRTSSAGGFRDRPDPGGRDRSCAQSVRSGGRVFPDRLRNTLSFRCSLTLSHPLLRASSFREPLRRPLQNDHPAGRSPSWREADARSGPRTEGHRGAGGRPPPSDHPGSNHHGTDRVSRPPTHGGTAAGRDCHRLPQRQPGSGRFPDRRSGSCSISSATSPARTPRATRRSSFPSPPSRRSSFRRSSNSSEATRWPRSTGSRAA